MFRLEKALDSGYRAWQRGDLSTAVEVLENLLAERPGALEALYPLARALHEKGESPRAIALLDAAVEDLIDKTGGLAHRAVIRYDLDDAAGLQEDIAALGSDNPMANALGALASARRGEWKIALLPAFSLWNAELVGRLLAVLEEAYASRCDASQDRFHHRLFASPPDDDSPATSERVDNEPTTTADEPLPKSYSRRADWIDELARRFDAADFANALAVARHKEASDDWRDDSTASLEIFASIATESPGKALRIVDQTIEANGPSLDLHFLRGLALVRDGNTLAAAHSFVRAARSADTIIYDVVTGLARELEIDLQRE